MILGFKQQFRQPTIDGVKIHTIRDDEKRRWAAGVPIQFATGVRTKQYDKFKDGVCTGTQRVFMTYDQGRLEITIGSKYLYAYQEREQLAINDGFESLSAFEDWFIPICQRRKDGVYTGRLIHWTDFEYK